MILAGFTAAGLVVLWLAFAAWLSFRQKITFRQAFVHAPVAALWRVDARALRDAGSVDSVIYVVSHQSRLDPALMLALLPEDTLHILDERSAKAAWLEPWRSLARTIAFNPEHVFVSRRLVRVLRGRGRLCVYIPPDAEPDTRGFRLYRAIARIALRADARVMPIHVGGADQAVFALRKAESRRGKLFPKLRVRALPPATMSELMERSEAAANTSSGVLYRRLAATAQAA